MAKEVFYGNFSCGHPGNIEIDTLLFQTFRDQEEEAKRKFSRLCPECFAKQLAKQKEEDFIKSFANAQKMNIPSLIGTLKQVPYAYVLREKMIQKFIQLQNSKNQKRLLKDLSITKEDIGKILFYILNKYTDSSWYIKRKDYDISLILRLELKRVIKSNCQLELEKQIEKDKSENTIYVNKEDKSFAHIYLIYSFIIIDYKKQKEFIEIVKSFGFKWEEKWIRSVNVNESYKDIITKISIELLSNGINCYIQNKSCRKNVLKFLEGGNFYGQT